MFKVFAVDHASSIHGDNNEVNFILCEDAPDAVDLAIHDPELYQLHLYEEDVIITELPYHIAVHLDQYNLSRAANRDATLFNIVNLATKEKRKAYLDQYDEEYDVSNRYYLRY